MSTLKVFFRSIRWIPAHLRYGLIYLEIWMRVLVRGLAIRPHLIHCHDTPLLPIAVTIAWLCRGKVIYDAHELESDKNGQTRWMAWCTLAIEKFCWRGVDGFVTVSSSILRWYMERFTHKDSALVYNSPVFNRDPVQDVPEFKGRYFHRKYGISEDQLVFVYLGLLGPGRGIETLLKVFTSQEVRAHVVFIGRGSLRETIVNHAVQNGRVHLHDVVPHEQVVPLVRTADYGFCMVECVSLSDYYSLPNKLFEYAFAGVPVLASNFPDIQELVERFQLGLCAVNEVDAIAHAVIRLQREGRQRMTSDIESLGWKAQAERLLAMYQRLTPTNGNVYNVK
ncbi:glycosyltransferase [Limnohabitans sp. TS-CS-82]|uniref:glycosyltransferase n=1 Tax=Limnohabitans sp. TS-CS-82 TaxID=2094193 RepID=UPI0013752FC7|nr:glycosyltransferase [Limnohabitans sp. TS-CS-82]